jgi:hypothetical protein
MFRLAVQAGGQAVILEMICKQPRDAVISCALRALGAIPMRYGVFPFSTLPGILLAKWSNGRTRLFPASYDLYT